MRREPERVRYRAAVVRFTMAPMRVQYREGVRIAGLAIDPGARSQTALWTHRPARRPCCGLVLGSSALAACWPGVLGIPMGRGAIAAGLRLELVPTAYGPGGAAALIMVGGERVFVVGPTTEALIPRPAEVLVLRACAHAQPPPGWLQRAADTQVPLRLVAPDAAAIEVMHTVLAEAGVAHHAPPWLGVAPPRRANVRLTLSGDGLRVDERPQASDAWMVAFALSVAPRIVFVHGPRADELAHQLASARLTVRLLHAPAQLTLCATPESRRPPAVGAADLNARGRSDVHAPSGAAPFDEG